MLGIPSSYQQVRVPIRGQIIDIRGQIIDIRGQIIESRIHIRNVPSAQQGRETGSLLMQKAGKRLRISFLLNSLNKAIKDIGHPSLHARVRPLRAWHASEPVARVQKATRILGPTRCCPRSRAGMAIFVPKGGISDYTPQLVESDAIHNILRKAGCSEISVFSGIDLRDQYLNFDIQKVLGNSFPRTGRTGIHVFRFLFAFHPRNTHRLAMSLITYELLEEES